MGMRWDRDGQITRQIGLGLGLSLGKHEQNGHLLKADLHSVLSSENGTHFEQSMHRAEILKFCLAISSPNIRLIFA